MVIVPMASPRGTHDAARERYEGTSLRPIPFHNRSSNVGTMRLDVLYGIKALDPQLTARISGTA